MNERKLELEEGKCAILEREIEASWTVWWGFVCPLCRQLGLVICFLFFEKYNIYIYIHTHTNTYIYIRNYEGVIAHVIAHIHVYAMYLEFYRIAWEKLTSWCTTDPSLPPLPHIPEDLLQLMIREIIKKNPLRVESWRAAYSIDILRIGIYIN